MRVRGHGELLHCCWILSFVWEFVGWAFCGHEAVEIPEEDSSSLQDCEPCTGNGSSTGGSQPTEAILLSRRDKVEAGLLSKVLLDYGRLAWIRSQSCSLKSSDLVSYVDRSTSGENRLLVISLDGVAGKGSD